MSSKIWEEFELSFLCLYLGFGQICSNPLCHLSSDTAFLRLSYSEETETDGLVLEAKQNSACLCTGKQDSKQAFSVGQ